MNLTQKDSRSLAAKSHGSVWGLMKRSEIHGMTIGWEFTKHIFDISTTWEKLPHGPN